MYTYGNVYMRCPASGETFWYDWCSFERFQAHYVFSFDFGRFLFVTGA